MTSKLNAIPIAVVQESPQTQSLGNALAVLHQIESMLESLEEQGQRDSIDLRRAPLARHDYQYIKGVLGDGEVRAELKALGLTRIRETAVSGVWWVVHEDTSGRVRGEFIEVTSCPELLMSPEQDIRRGRETLRARMDRTLNAVDSRVVEARMQAMGLSGIGRDSSNREVNQPEEAG